MQLTVAQQVKIQEAWAVKNSSLTGMRKQTYMIHAIAIN